ncbi:M48 family metalloprotease [Rhodococcus sp. NCIMB 12038]|uniref:M48 family metalloprotease n=1 Tax=Rhodococcus sp. NCIMB 12038 TaxID=933800 RepID=UPI0015C62600|nr:M48 family metalloprotease [Rhodococcus sp. NCIMB 12038]
MTTPTTDDLMQRRQQRCRELVSDISSRIHGPWTPPDVVFVDKAGSTRGGFSWRHNRVTVVVPGFLDDSATLDDSIDAVIAHEMGHWADPDVVTEARRAVMAGVPLLAVSAVLLVVSLLLPPLPSAAAALSAIVTLVAALWVIARLSWPGEERADRFAVDQVGIDAVVAMLENPPKKAARGATPTHPSMRHRIRLARHHEQRRQAM